MLKYRVSDVTYSVTLHRSNTLGEVSVLTVVSPQSRLKLRLVISGSKEDIVAVLLSPLVG